MIDISMTTPLAIYIKEQIEIHRAAIAKIEDRRPDLKADRVRAAPNDEDARQIIVLRASLTALERGLDEQSR